MDSTPLQVPDGAACLLSGLHHLPGTRWDPHPLRSQMIQITMIHHGYSYSDMDITSRAVENCTPSGPAVPILEAVLDCHDIMRLSCGMAQ